MAEASRTSSSQGGAAFFDLDRTLLAGASGEVFSAAMRAAGLINRSIPGEGLLYRLFNNVGETLPSMVLARQAVLLAKGKPQAAVQQAAAAAAAQLEEMLQPLATPLFDEHRAAGRLVVMATTTPYDMVKPLADRLGLDDVIATRYRVGDDGFYDGTIHGPFVWSAGKLAAVRRWAESHGIDLRASYAYSDSVYDAPLLAAVGHPFAVNPDPRLAVLAAARRWPTIDLSTSEPRPARIPIVNVEIQRLVLAFSNPLFIPFARFDVDGVDNIPRTGPVIVVGNHRSYFDPVAMAVTIARSNRTVRFLGKKEVFDAPIIGQLAAAMGGIRVDRGTGSEEPLRAAAEALERGEMVALMPQGTIPRGKAFFDPKLRGRWGAARLAAMTHAPVVPIGLWGTEKVWPRAARLPNVLNVTNPPLVTIRVGPPVDLKYRSADADTRRIMQALTDLLPEESRARRQPSEAEIASATPPNARGDGAGEATRRPGTD